MADTNFKKALVALDTTLMDGFILEYLSKFHQVFGIEEIIFLHTVKEIDTRLEEYSKGAETAKEDIKSDLCKSIEKYNLGSVNYEVVVEHGSSTDLMLKHCVEKNVDLIVMGRKRSLNGSGIVSSHIARNSPSSILFVTQNINPSLKNVLVPVDFSEHSELAFQAGSAIEKRTKINLSLINIYDVPIGYYKLGKSYDEFAEIMQGHAKKDYELFLKKNKSDKAYPCEFKVRRSHSKIDIVFEHALESRSDLIIIGSQGRTNASAVLLGSFAEKMVFRDTDVPVLIMKKEGENMSLLDSLLSL